MTAKSMLTITVSIILLVALIFVGVNKSRKNSENINAISSGSTYWLSQASLVSMKDLSSKGDKNAAFSIYKYYTFSEYNANLSFFWLQRSAELQHPIATFNLAEKYREIGDIEKSKKWAKIAVELGIQDAKSLIVELEN